MKRCPQCNRTYTDDALSFCLDDGSPLTIASGPPPSDPSATVQYPTARDTTPQPTIAYHPGQAAPPPPPTPPPAWSPMPPTQTQKRSAWPWLLGIGAVLIFMVIGVVILIFAVAHVTNDNNSNRVVNNSNNSNNANWKANRNANKNTNSDNTNTNENTNTSTTPSAFTDDFATQSWGTGTWDDGRAWYSDEEYHMHAISGRFIEMYAPERPEYKTKNATVRVGLRSIDGNPPNTGYGLVVHGLKKNGQLEDYGFLLYNRTDPKYKIVLHKGGSETNIVSWTSSSVIRTGTSPNQIEVRIRDLKLDLYINGQFITSIADSANYKDGLVGFYTSDAGEVAFDDLEINR